MCGSRNGYEKSNSRINQICDIYVYKNALPDRITRDNMTWQLNICTVPVTLNQETLILSNENIQRK